MIIPVNTVPDKDISNYVLAVLKRAHAVMEAERNKKIADDERKGHSV